MNDRISKLFEIAISETKKGNNKKAVATYQKVLNLPNVPEQALHLSYWGIGEIYLNNKKYNEAEHYLLKAVNLEPLDSYYQYLLGCTYTYKNEIEKAIYHLEKAVKIDDSVDVYWGQLGWVVGYNKDWDQGVKYLKKALNINPNHFPTLRDLCMLYTQSQKFNEALVCIEEAEKNHPNNEEIYELKNQIEFFKSEFERLA